MRNPLGAGDSVGAGGVRRMSPGARSSRTVGTESLHEADLYRYSILHFGEDFFQAHASISSSSVPTFRI